MFDTKILDFFDLHSLNVGNNDLVNLFFYFELNKLILDFEKLYFLINSSITNDIFHIIMKNLYKNIQLFIKKNK